ASCKSCAGSRCGSSPASPRRSTGRRRSRACTATRSTPRPRAPRSAACSRTSRTSRPRARESSASCWATPRPETSRATGMRGARGLVAPLARFAGALRSRGVRVGLSEEIDAAAALALVDLLDRAEVHRTLRIALRLPRDAWDVFDRLFEEYWDGRRAPRHDALDQAMKSDRRGPAQWRWDGQRVRLELPDGREPPQGDTPGYSPEALLRRKPF